MFNFLLSQYRWSWLDFRLLHREMFARIAPESRVTAVLPSPENSTPRDVSMVMPEKISLHIQDDIKALLICEKVEGQWDLYLTAFEGQKCLELFGQNFDVNEKVALYKLMDSPKFDMHQRLVAEVLDVGPTAHNWTMLFQRMYERPIKILTPVEQTELIVDIRMELSEQPSYEIGHYYQFYVYLNHRTYEQACFAKFQEILHFSEQLTIQLGECISNLESNFRYNIIFDLNQDIKNLCVVKKFDSSSQESNFQRIRFYSNQIRLQLNMSQMPYNFLTTIGALNDKINHLCTLESFDVFSYLGDKIIHEQKIQQLQQRNLVLKYVVLKSEIKYPLFGYALDLLDALLSSLIELYVLNGTPPYELRLEANVDSKKQFHAKVYLLDHQQKFFQLYQETQQTNANFLDQSHFYSDSLTWQNQGGDLKVSAEHDEQTLFEFSIFAEQFKPREFILKPEEIHDFEKILQTISYQNKKSILLADDGVVNIKFLLKFTLEFLGLGHIPARSPTSKMDFSKTWKDLACYILVVGDWYFICVPDGRMAQQFLTLWQPDAMITDQEMPHLDGTSLIEWFRKNFADQKHVKIALHSAKPEANRPEILEPLEAVFLTKADKRHFNSFVESVRVSEIRTNQLTY